MTTNGSPSQAALKMAQATEVCRWHEGSRLTLYFAADGKRLIAGGRDFGKFSGNTVQTDLGLKAAFIVEYPFAPSVASLDDMVRERERTGKKRIIYDSDRWEADKRVDEQISVYGPDVADDWKLERLIDALEDHEERKVAA